jgi:hypothetical protein
MNGYQVTNWQVANIAWVLDKVIIHIQNKMEYDGVSCHHSTQNGVKFLICEYFLSGIFPIL